MSQPVITLLSDLGTKDSSVSVARATLAHYAPGAAIVDISHHVAPYDLEQAAYLLLSASRHFAAGTIHLVMTDVFGAAHPRMILAERDGCFFIAPDNGVLPMAFGQAEPVWVCYEYTMPFSFSTWVSDAGHVIRRVAAGGPLPYSTATASKIPLPDPYRIMDDGVDCKVLSADRYENVILAITRKEFDAALMGRKFGIRVLRAADINSISANYNDVPAGRALCRFNDSGFLEVAVNRGSAAVQLGLNAGNGADLRHRTIRIFFGD